MRGERLRRLKGAAATASLIAGVTCAAAGCLSGSPASGTDATPAPASATPAAVAVGAAACAGCHPDHVADWSLSVHASASDDPVFVAMNARGQRETGGALGDFCVRCHAPLALARGATTDGQNLQALDPSLRGVTCVVCHTASAVAGSLAIADDGVMRGPIADAVPSPAHRSAYSAAHDRSQPAAAELCGACHGVTNGHGLRIERTIDEWRETAYAAPGTLKTCGHCHMPETPGTASQTPGSPARPVHGHAMPGLDWGAGSAAQRKLVQATLDPALSASLCVIPGEAGTGITVTVENALIGHAWPSGATQDRRAWTEVVAYAGGPVVYESGLEPGDAGAAGATSGAPSPPLLLLGQWLFDDVGSPTPFAWGAFTGTANLLSPATADPAGAMRTASVLVTGTAVDRVTSRVLVRALDRDVADTLVSSGDLAPEVAAAVPTLALRATDLEWTAALGAACLP
ncbi:MAG: hypothetical protein JOZ69_15550 [Myxococcales bacterium]|nr:hypothetical protein [Myxococcales bacterium]